jgi:hypothetical protein
MTMNAYFTMSEAQAEDFPDWETRQLTVPLGSLGVQLTYEHLRDCEDGRIIATYENGLWMATADGRKYSDVVIASDTSSPKGDES